MKNSSFNFFPKHLSKIMFVIFWYDIWGVSLQKGLTTFWIESESVQSAWCVMVRTILQTDSSYNGVNIVWSRRLSAILAFNATINIHFISYREIPTSMIIPPELPLITPAVVWLAVTSDQCRHMHAGNQTPPTISSNKKSSRMSVGIWPW